MGIYLILTAFIVNFVLTLVQSHNQMVDQFQNLFESIVKNDTGKSGIYHGILQEKLAKEREVFNAMDNELQTARYRNLFRRRNVFNKRTISKTVIAKKRETDNNLSTTTVRQYTLEPPIDLHEIGYNGTWEQFCDKNEINKDSPPYPEHTLRTLRLEICYKRDLNKFTHESVHTLFAAYKYCVQARSKVDEILEKLVAAFSEGDDKKKAKLFALAVPQWDSVCFRDCQHWIRVFCIDRDNPYFTMFYELLTRVCNAEWLTPTKMRQIMKDECDGLRIPRTDWEGLIPTINYRGPRNF